MDDATPMSYLCEVVITAPDPVWLKNLSRMLVEQGLCASAHNFAAVRSIYRWQGDVYEREEGRVSLHTGYDRVSEIVALVKQEHPYQVPGISIRPIMDGNPDYLSWIAQETDPEKRESKSTADLRWRVRFAEQSVLAEHVNRWSLAEAVPGGIADVLRLARKLLIDSYYEYGYSLIAISWGFVVMEACLRACLPAPSDGENDKRTFGTLIDQARRSNFITQEEAVALFGIVNIRNNTFHRAHLLPKPPPDSYSPDTALEMLEAIHDAISDLYTRAANEIEAQRDT